MDQIHIKRLIKRLSFFSICKILFFGLSCFLVPLFFVFGILSAFGEQTLIFNGAELRGLKAIIGGPFMGLGFALLLSLIVSLWTWLGLFISSKFFIFKIKYQGE